MDPESRQREAPTMIASSTLTPGFRWADEPWGRSLRCEMLDVVAPHLFTTRDLVLASDGDGWNDAAASVGVPIERLARLRQVHGATVIVLRRSDRLTQSSRPAADILISDDSVMAMAVQVADCVPLLLADRRTGCVAAAHAGWRGTVARVAPTAVAAMHDTFGTNPSDLVAAIGPSIGPCCYQVGPDVRHAFEAAGFEPSAVRCWFSDADADGRTMLDLWAATEHQLVCEAGLDPANVHALRLCTATRLDLFYSFRREGERAGRIAAVIRTR
jgi:purine-nucleoside/S-methyl-5'-thioadenosine phosphorylase / adenosine deaminase